MISLILEIIKNIVEFWNRESASDEKMKKISVKSTRSLKKAVFYARQIFDGKGDYKGLDLLLQGKLDKQDYEMYLKLRKKFNRCS